MAAGGDGEGGRSGTPGTAVGGEPAAFLYSLEAAEIPEMPEIRIFGISGISAQGDQAADQALTSSRARSWVSVPPSSGSRVDFYPTPHAAVPPLIPYLRGVRTFAEPCCGDGALVRHLESAGLRCVYAGDIATGQDALAARPTTVRSMRSSPTRRTRGPLMHALIAHFQRIAPTWLLLELDWAATKQAIPYLTNCSDIVTIGRLRWIPGSPHTGKENHGWYRFDVRHKGEPIFHTQGAPPTTPGRSCSQCGAAYQSPRSDTRFCSDACRQRAYRQRLSVTQT